MHKDSLKEIDLRRYMNEIPEGVWRRRNRIVIPKL